MSTTEDREGYIKGLRALADVLEQHPEVPLPYDGTCSAISFNSFLCSASPRAELASAASAFAGVAWKERNEPGLEYFYLLGSLHGLNLGMARFRDDEDRANAVAAEAGLAVAKDVTTISEIPVIADAMAAEHITTDAEKADHAARMERTRTAAQDAADYQAARS